MRTCIHSFSQLLKRHCLTFPRVHIKIYQAPYQKAKIHFLNMH